MKATKSGVPDKRFNTEVKEPVRCRYSLVIDYNARWVEGMGIESLTEYLEAKIALFLGSYPTARGTIKKLKLLKGG